MTTYSLRKRTKAEDFKGSHANAALTALEQLGKGTAAQITEQVEKHHLLKTKTKMETGKLISWILCDLARMGKLSRSGKANAR